MAGNFPWEPEEAVGKLWHRFASRLDAPPTFEEARVELKPIGARLGVFFRGLGGGQGIEIRATAAEASGHRLSWKRRLGTVDDYVERASFDGGVLRLPASLAALPSREANGALYLWLAAQAAHAPVRDIPADPLHADLAALRAVRAMARAALADAPGLGLLQAELASACLALRRRGALPPLELALERVIRHLLGDGAPLCRQGRALMGAIDSGNLAAMPVAPAGYRPFLPVPLWLDLREAGSSPRADLETRETHGTPEQGEGAPKRARRHKSDQADRRDSLILHRFEAILSWAEFLNLNRRVEDDENDDAKKAADDQDEIALGQTSKAPATRIKLHLDLAPEDADREAISGAFTYPEWDCRAGAYLPAHARVLASRLEEGDPETIAPDAAARRRIRAVRRQFEALRQGRRWTGGNLDGDELDTDAAIRAAADLAATGECEDRVWRQYRPLQRDLAVSILFDASRSTESAVAGGRSVIDVAREALAALAWGLDACGDDCAIHAFSSLRRERVFMLEAKRFGEPMGRGIEARIAALKPGFYTRLGAAIRHSSAELAGQSQKRRLLLVITDGKPNDLDHYEGRHGIEDSAMAVREARRAGHSVFGIAIDRDGQAWFPRIFGRGGYALVPHADHLTQVLPQIYRQLVAA